MLCHVGRRIPIFNRPVRRASLRGLSFAIAAMASGWLLATAPGVAAEDSHPFSLRSHDIQGLIQQVWPLRVSQCEGAETDLLVLSTDGAPPNQEKRLTWMPCGSALEPGDPRILERPLPDATVAVDVARVPGRRGPQLLMISANGIRIEALASTDPPRDLAIPGGLPLPPRPWEIGRLPIVDDWHSNGRATALVPSLRGGWLVDLATGETRQIEMPIYASYRTYLPYLPATVWKWMIQEVTWPAISRADDNGDGLLDLFALSRWGIWIYHAGPEGLPDAPSRRLDVVPFDTDEERRHETTVNNYFAHDLNGDQRADLLLNTIAGGLMKGRSSTKVFLNGGDGASLDRAPDVVREKEGGLSGIIFVDVDGDGVDEMLETTMEFGIVQMMRILVTRKAKTQVRVLVLDPESPDGTRTIFKDEFSFRLNFGDSTMSGLVPSVGDWNGDGVQDMFVTRGDDEISFRIGSAEEGEAVFGRAKGRQPVGLDSGESRIADLNGDGLDDIVAFTDKYADQPLIVLHNRGRLPGTPPSLRAVSP
jgi:hypothetical protein